MSRTVNCMKLKKEAPGLDFPPYPGETGTRIWQSISKEAWQNWMDVQTRLVNENRLNLADVRARKYLKEQMEKYLFEDGDVEAQGYVAS
jgi:Fe-S cluster biosynthesis and repair protein YggX